MAKKIYHGEVVTVVKNLGGRDHLIRLGNGDEIAVNDRWLSDLPVEETAEEVAEDGDDSNPDEGSGDSGDGSESDEDEDPTE